MNRLKPGLIITPANVHWFDGLTVMVFREGRLVRPGVVRLFKRNGLHQVLNGFGIWVPSAPYADLHDYARQVVRYQNEIVLVEAYNPSTGALVSSEEPAHESSGPTEAGFSTDDWVPDAAPAPQVEVDMQFEAVSLGEEPSLLTSGRGMAQGLGAPYGQQQGPDRRLTVRDKAVSLYEHLINWLRKGRMAE